MLKSLSFKFGGGLMETDYIDMIKAHPCPPKPKIPVEVVLKTNVDGRMTPLFIKWKTELSCCQIERLPLLN